MLCNRTNRTTEGTVIVARACVWPFGELEPRSVYELVLRILDGLEGQAWRTEHDHYGWRV